MSRYTASALLLAVFTVGACSEDPASKDGAPSHELGPGLESGPGIEAGVHPDGASPSDGNPGTEAGGDLPPPPAATCDVPITLADTTQHDRTVGSGNAVSSTRDALAGAVEP